MDFSSFAMPPDRLAKVDFAMPPDLAMPPDSLATVETALAIFSGCSCDAVLSIADNDSGIVALAVLSNVGSDAGLAFRGMLPSLLAEI